MFESLGSIILSLRKSGICLVFASARQNSNFFHNSLVDADLKESCAGGDGLTSSRLTSLPWGTIEGLGHMLSSVLLLLFAISHFAAFTLNRPSQHSLNPVFPFVTNQTMYLAAGVFELVTSLVCYLGKGRKAARSAVMVFVVVMVWYRWAYYYTGGNGSCDCLGVWGSVLHLTKTQERIMPIIALVLLTLTMLPFLVCKFFLGRELGKPDAVNLVRVFVLLMSVAANSALGGQTIEVTGRYDTERRNPRTGIVHTNLSRHVAFAFKMSGSGWSIYATNLDNSGVGLKTPWEGLIYDGDETYTFLPIGNEIGSNSRSNDIKATISPGPIFLRDYDEWIDFDVIWLAYGMCPKLLSTNQAGSYEIPLPWTHSRISAHAHGFEWKITSTAEGRFVEACQVVRNTNLDLTLDEEMIRPGMKVPNSILAARNSFQQALESRRSIPHGFVVARYACAEWFTTNGITIPKNSEQLRYSELFPYPAFQARVSAHTLVVRNVDDQLVPSVTRSISVEDYRFRRASSNDVSASIRYILSPRSSWKRADNPDLAQQAERDLKLMKAFNRGESSNRKSIFAWSLLALVIVPFVIMQLRKKTNQ